MDNIYKDALWCNTVLKIGIAVCITCAAIKFRNANLLWWYILLPFLGSSIEYKEKHQ